MVAKLMFIKLNLFFSIIKSTSDIIPLIEPITSNIIKNKYLIPATKPDWSGLLTL